MIVESYEDVIHLSGALRSNFWETIHTAISLTLRRHPTGVIIDCTEITECTPEGANTFLDAVEFIGEHDARVICVNVPPQVLDVMRATPGVKSQLPMAPSIEAARKSLDLLVEKTSKKRGAAAEVDTRIVVYLAGSARDEHALRIAERMADSYRAEIVLTSVIVVPRELPIQSPMAEQEEAAAAVIARARTALSAKSVPVSARVERGRDVPSGLQDAIEDCGATHLVLPLSAKPERLDEDLKLVRSALSKITAQLVIVRPEVGTR